MDTTDTPSRRSFSRFGPLVALLLATGVLIISAVQSQNAVVYLVLSAAAGASAALLVEFLWPNRAHSAASEKNKLAIPDLEARGAVTVQLLVGIIAPLLAVSGALIYAIFSLTYEEFYMALGTNPSDVGLSYASTLSSATGVILYLALLSLPFATTYALTTRTLWIRSLASNPEWSRIPRSEILRHVFLEGVVVLVIILILVSGFMVAILSTSAEQAAIAVQQGKAISPIDLGPVGTFPLRADRARVGSNEVGQQDNKNRAPPAGSSPYCEEPGIQQLYGKDLLYLGQANSIVVLYDAACRRAVYLSASSVVLHIYSTG